MARTKVLNVTGVPSITPRNNNPKPLGNTSFRGNTSSVKFAVKQPRGK